MARASAGVFKALAVGGVFAVLSVLWGATGPAQADGGGVVGAVTGAGSDAVGGVVGPITDPVTHVTDPVTHAVTHAVPGPVASAVPSPVASAVADPVPTVKKAAGSAAGQPRQPGAGPQHTAPLVGGAQPGEKARTGSATRAAGTSTTARPSRHKAGSRRAVRERPPSARPLLLAAVRRDAELLTTGPTLGRRQVVDASETSAEQACRTSSLAASDLLRCARVDVLLPNLGGPGMVLLPISLALIGAGLVMAVHGRRRRGPAVGRAS
ncbi:hypothetical protein [Nocardioides panacihumi]